MEQAADLSNEHLQGVLEKIEAEYPGFGVLVLIANGVLGHKSMSNIPRTILIGVLEHVVMHLRGDCPQCKEASEWPQ